MRFLHTGDWHVGRPLRGRSRLDEFADALDFVVTVAAHEEVDAVLLAGDIYDQRVISADADRLLFQTLLRLAERQIQVVAVPGNHDSAARLSAFAPLLERIGAHVVARVVPPSEGAVVHVGARSGDEHAAIACLPFVSPRRFADAAGLFEDTAKGYVDFDDGMARILQAYEDAFEADAVNIVLSHVFVSGAQPGGSEREITIGADYAVSPQHLPATASYIALGHIHKPQRVRGVAAEARYCGSLLQLDFGERGQDKSLAVVDVAPGKPPRVTEVPIDAGRPLMDVTGSLAELEAIASRNPNAYLRVNLEIERATPGIADQVRKLLPNALDVRLVLPDSGEPSQERPSMRGLDPRAQFVAYYRAHDGSEPPEEILAAFERVFDEATV